MIVDEAIARVWRVVHSHPAGLCYYACEAIYHLAGARASGLEPRVHRVHRGRETLAWHWWLETREGQLVDVTGHQFEGWVPAYRLGKRGRFRSRRPSATAQSIMRQARLVTRGFK